MLAEGCKRRSGAITRIILSLALLISLPARAQNDSVAGPIEPLNPKHATKGLVSKKPYEPITAKERLHWLVKSTVGPESLVAGMLSAGINTAANEPREFGSSWEGFGKRYGMRLTGISTGNAIEAGLGALWGEDPRYDRVSRAPFTSRVCNVIKLTFAARYRDGHVAPAYGRLIAVPGNNLLSNTWRARGETQAGDIALRTVLGFIGRMGANTFVEFWPDVRRHILPAHNDNE
jgi:hypothetical protein